MLKILLAILTALQLVSSVNPSSEVEITDEMSDVFMVIAEYRTVKENLYIDSDEIAGYTDLQECIDKAKELNRTASETWKNENGDWLYSSYVIMYIMESGEYCDILYIEKELLGWE